MITQLTTTSTSTSTASTHLHPMYTFCPDPWYKLVANGSSPLVLLVLFTVNKCEPAGQLELAALHDATADGEMYTHESLPSELSASA